MAKLALCIGINDYPGTGMDLQGCANDAQDWAALLGRRGFALVRPPLLDAQATKAAMVQAIGELVGRLGPDDLAVLTFSGHGTYELDTNGDEDSGFDQALCPHDVETAGEALVDDELHALFSAKAPGARIVLIADSCHSGSVHRRIGPPAAGAPRKRFLPMERWMPRARLAQARARTAAAPTAATTRGAAGLAAGGADLLLSGCGDGEEDFSYDAVIQGRPNGAFTFYALAALASLPPSVSYLDWHAEIVASLPQISFPQQPQIRGSAAACQRMALS